MRQYVEELEQRNPLPEPVHELDQVSTTDPDSTYATKGGTPARWCFLPWPYTFARMAFLICLILASSRL